MPNDLPSIITEADGYPGEGPGLTVWLQEHRTELLAAIHEREDQLIAAAAEPLAELEGRLAELQLLSNGLQFCTRGAGFAGPDAVTLDNLVRCVRKDKRMLREPFVSGPRRVVR